MVKIPKEITGVLLDLGIELMKTLKDLNAKGKLKLPTKLKNRKGEKPNVDVSKNSKRIRKKNSTVPDRNDNP